MRCAVVDRRTGAVLNMIVADPAVDSLSGCTLVAIPDSLPVNQRWTWTKRDGFKPTPELQAEMDAQAAIDAQLSAIAQAEDSAAGVV